MFALYPVERHWWSFADYGALMKITQDVRPRTVLEFGPGSSTMALVEGGAKSVTSLEDDPAWMAVARSYLASRPEVTLVPYVWSEDLSVPSIDGLRFDMAFVDGPRDTPKRVAVARYVMAHADVVVLPWECPTFRHSYVSQIDMSGWDFKRVDSGPLTYSFYVMRRA